MVGFFYIYCLIQIYESTLKLPAVHIKMINFQVVKFLGKRMKIQLSWSCVLLVLAYLRVVSNSETDLSEGTHPIPVPAHVSELAPSPLQSPLEGIVCLGRHRFLTSCGLKGVHGCVWRAPRTVN